MRFPTLFAALAAALFMSTAAHAADQFCGGPPSGNYQATMSSLAAGSFHLAAPVVTQGSLDNLTRLDSGQCAAAPAQRDAYEVYSYMNRGRWPDVRAVATVGDEVAHLVCADYTHVGMAGRLGSISDLAGRRDLTIAIGQTGSGSFVTWQVLSHYLPYLDPSRGGPQVNVSVDPSSAATLRKVKAHPLSNALAGKDNVDCLFFVSTPNSDTMKRVDANGNTLELIAIDDQRVLSVTDHWGQPLYAPASIRPGTYPNLQSSRYSPFYGQSPVRTIQVESVLFANSGWYARNPSYAQWIANWARSLNVVRY